eukprot:jgi/Botrbrau1/22107/Bobra.0206s0033.1
MTGGVCLAPPSGGGLGRGLGDVRGSSGCDQYAPVNFIYRSFHDSIRSELESLLERVLALEPTSPSDGLVATLERLRERYRFLEQVYKCHSTLEDEVVYPALDLKVKNVTLAYMVEHEDEERLFEQLSHLLGQALSGQGKQRAVAVRQFVCKVEEVHTTLRKHLAKEEEQLLPLLLQHFTFAEQAELVAQFLCCIPLDAVEVVLGWLRPMLPEQEQAQLLSQVRAVVDDQNLLQLLVKWLSPDQALRAGSAPPGKSDIPIGCCRSTTDAQGSCPLGLPGHKPLLQHITHFHGAIRSALDSFAAVAHEVMESGSCGSASLASLTERHRFLRSVCSFHSASENEVLLPVARKLIEGTHDAVEACALFEADHKSEASILEDLGRKLMDIRSSMRRGAREAEELLVQLCGAVDAARACIVDHMEREEASLLPVLVAHLCVAEQRAIVWGTLRYMPLRLLERVLPWLAGKLSREEVEDLLLLIKMAAPEVDSVLADLLSMWVQRGCARSPEPKSSDDPELYINETCRRHLCGASSLDSSGTVEAEGPPSKRARLESVTELVPSRAASFGNLDRRVSASPQLNPIDHIFQFHKALRRDLRALEEDTQTFVASVEESNSWSSTQLQQLEGQFRFLWGIYQAHSDAEDEVVFPALEAKEALHNVSHAYTLDHQQEAQLFRDVDEAFRQLKEARKAAEVVRVGRHVERLCAALRASLEQHLRAEEQELWPLFAENFTTAEQEDIIGAIIGRTGADALSAMLSWVLGSITEEEQEAFMDSIRNAAKNTSFQNWLEATVSRPIAGGLQPPVSGRPEAPAQGTPGPSVGSLQEMALADVASYLVPSTLPAPSPGGGGGQSAATVFRPGWESIFRINQATLEQAVRRVSADPCLDQDRKAYLMQNIMASRYIVANQKRLLGYPASSGPTYHNAAIHQLGCEHYARKCRIEGSCCSRVYTCRRCHDDAEDHLLNVKDVTHMVCMVCGTRQPCAASCSACGVDEARYYCAICKLWDDDPERSIYHCPFCNLCRVGRGLGIDSCHCMHCNSCVHVGERLTHVCRPVASCPVCTERLFDSNQPYRELSCGHFMHSHCFAQHTRYNYTCPVCFKSLGDMSVYFRMLDNLLERDRADMPPLCSNMKQAILCCDCGGKSEAPYHYVYHKCTLCGSFNTRLM